MLANNETGVLQPVEEIGKNRQDAARRASSTSTRCRARARFPSTCAASAAISAPSAPTRCTGPRASGAIFVRRGTPLEPLLVGGSHERRRRAGTENVPGIVGLAKAAELAMHSLEDGTIDRAGSLRDRLEAGILQLPGTGVNGAQMLGAPGPSHLGTWESTNRVPARPTPPTSGSTIWRARRW